MNIVDVVSIGIAIMVFALVTVIGKVVIFFAIAWWIYHLAISNNKNLTKLKSKVIISAFLFLSCIECLFLWQQFVSAEHLLYL